MSKPTRMERGWTALHVLAVLTLMAVVGLWGFVVKSGIRIQSEDAVRDSLRRELIAERAARVALEKANAFSRTHACYYRGDRVVRADR